MIWEKLEKEFKGKGRQLEVVRLLLKYGLCVKDESIYLDNIRIPYSSIANVLGIDRRVVVEAIKSINKNEYLRKFFRDLLPAGPFLRKVARLLGYTVLVVTPYRDEPGILANVSKILASANINIVQVIAEEPHLFQEQKLYIVVEGEVPGEIINKITKLSFLKNLTIG